MENTKKWLVALNLYSIRELVDTINNKNIRKEDVLDLIHKDDSYYLLYYEDCD